VDTAGSDFGQIVKSFLAEDRPCAPMAFVAKKKNALTGTVHIDFDNAPHQSQY
jgi:hypothetical protein